MSVSGFIETTDIASESFDAINSASDYDGTIDKASESCDTVNNTLYYNSDLIWRTVSRRVDEVKAWDHPRCEASTVIWCYDLIHETWYSTPDQSLLW